MTARPAAVAAVLLVLASLFGAHLVAVLLCSAVTVICVAIVALSFAIAEVVVQTGWGVVPRRPVPSARREA